MKTLTVVVLLALPSVARAQTYSLADCVRMSRTSSLEAARGGLEEKRALAARHEAVRSRLPQLVGAGKFTRSDDDTTNLPDDNAAVLRLEQNLTPFSPDWVRGQQRSAEARAAAFGAAASAQDAGLAVKQLYFSILREEDSVRSLDQIETHLKSLLDTVLPKFTIGRVAAFDPVKVRVALSDLARLRDQTRAQLRGDRFALSQALGLEGDAWVLKPLSAEPKLFDEALAPGSAMNNPTLDQLTAQIEAARLGVKAVERARAPDLTAYADYGYTGQAARDTNKGWTLSAAVRVPIFNWGRITAQAAQERASADLAGNALETERRKIASDLVSTMAGAKAHLADRARLNALLPDVRDAARASVERYRRGGTGILEVSDAVNLWLQTMVNERAAYYGYLSDLARMERLTGGAVKIAYED